MKTDKDCIFCKIVAGEIPCFKLYEDDQTLAFMDINPFNPGHCLAIPKAHYANAFEIPDAEIAAAAMTARRVAAAVNRALAPDGINLLQANGEAAGQSVHHVHFHIFPRRHGDNASLNWGLVAGDMDEIKANAEKIAAALEG
jgi:histidine triad (HIT) family protein